MLEYWTIIKRDLLTRIMYIEHADAAQDDAVSYKSRRQLHPNCSGRAGRLAAAGHWSVERNYRSFWFERLFEYNKVWIYFSRFSDVFALLVTIVDDFYCWKFQKKNQYDFVLKFESFHCESGYGEEGISVVQR